MNGIHSFTHIPLTEHLLWVGHLRNWRDSSKGRVKDAGFVGLRSSKTGRPSQLCNCGWDKMTYLPISICRFWALWGRGFCLVFVALACRKHWQIVGAPYMNWALGVLICAYGGSLCSQKLLKCLFLYISWANQAKTCWFLAFAFWHMEKVARVSGRDHPGLCVSQD